jgi:hypothetical protein
MSPTFARRPDTGQPNNVVKVTFTGTGFDTTLAVTAQYAAASIAVSNVNSVSPTELTADFTLTPETEGKDYLVTVAHGQTGVLAGTFTVTTGNEPVITSISPNVGSRGGAVPVVVTGANFQSGATLQTALPQGLTFSQVRVINSTQIIAVANISQTAWLYTQQVRVAQLGQTSGTRGFTVSSSRAPVLTQIYPTSGAQGETISQVIISGTDVSPGSTVQISGTGITGGAVNHSTEALRLNLPFTISGTAELGAHTVTVTNNVGVSNALTFTVTPGTSNPDFAIVASPTDITANDTDFSAPVEFTVSSIDGFSGPVLITYNSDTGIEVDRPNNQTVNVPANGQVKFLVRFKTYLTQPGPAPMTFNATDDPFTKTRTATVNVTRA